MTSSSEIFLLIILFELIYDLFFTRETVICIKNQTTFLKQLKLLFIIGFHHIISIFLIFGWIFYNKNILILYILINIITIVSWMFNKGLCYITVIQNIICNWEEKKPFNHIFSILNIPINENTRIYFKSYTLVCMLYAIYKISK